MSAEAWSERPATAWMIAGLLLAAGFVAGTRLRVLPEPDAAAPWIEVSLSVPGHAAETVDRLLAGRVEDLLSTIEGVRTRTAVSRRDELLVRADCAPGIRPAVVRSVLSEKVHRFCAEQGGRMSVRRIAIGTRGGTAADRHLRVGIWSAGELPLDEVRRTVLPCLLAIRDAAAVTIEGEWEWGTRIRARRDAVLGGGLRASILGAGIRSAEETEHPGSIPVMLPAYGTIHPLSHVAVRERCRFTPRVLWRIDGCEAIVLTVLGRPGSERATLEREVRTGLHRCLQAALGRYCGALLDDSRRQTRWDSSGPLRVACILVAAFGVAVALLCRSIHAGLRFAAMPGCGLSGIVIMLVLTDRPLTLAGATGAVLGLGCLLPWGIDLMARFRIDRSRHLAPLLGAAAGAAQIACARVFPGNGAGDMLGESGLALVAACLAGLAGVPLLSVRSSNGPGPRLPQVLTAPVRRAIMIGRKHRRGVAVMVVALTGIPVWLIPRDLPAEHPLFRLHLLTFGWRACREYRPVIDRVFGGLVHLAVTRTADAEQHAGTGPPVIEVGLALPRGSTLETARTAALLFEREALVMTRGRARVVTMVQAEQASVRVEFLGRAGAGTLPYRVCECLRGIAAGIGNTRVSVIGHGPGFQSGQGSLPTVRVEARAYDRDFLDIMVRQAGMFLASDPAVHAVDLLDSSRPEEEETEIRMLVDPPGAEGSTAREVADVLADHARWQGMLADNRTGVCVEGSLGDTLMVVGRGPGGCARALKHLLRVTVVPAPAAVVREGREYVRRLGVVVDGSGESAADLVDALCHQIPVPPGCRLTVLNEGEEYGLLLILPPSLGLALVAVLLCASAVTNTWRAFPGGLISSIGAVAGVSAAAILFPRAPGAWPYAVAGAVGLICLHTGIVAREGWNGAARIYRCWILLQVASLAVAFFSDPGVAHAAWPVRSVALWIGTGAGIGLPLTGILTRIFCEAEAARS